MISVILLVTFLYFSLIISLIIGFDRISIFNFKIKNNNRKFTIIIPFRNESINIKELVTSLALLDYPISNYEIIFINDSSTDNSVPLLTEFIIKNSNWKLIDSVRKTNSPKKDAINTAINHAKYDWIITTDADCKVPKKWLQSFNSFMEDNPTIKMIAAPVSYAVNNSFLHQFQLLDFLSLIGTTIGSFGINKPFMCNGANLCYSKQLFFDLNGFVGNDNLASGDDVFLLEKAISKYPKQVKYLKTKEALVLTKPESDFKSLVSQRIRWASKTSATKSTFGKLTGILVFLQNGILIWSLIFGLWSVNYTFFAIGIFLSKLLVDYILLKKTYEFVDQKLNVINYLLSSLVYPFFVVFVVIKSFFTKVQWKGREF